MIFSHLAPLPVFGKNVHYVGLGSRLSVSFPAEASKVRCLFSHPPLSQEAADDQGSGNLPCPPWTLN